MGCGVEEDSSGRNVVVTSCGDATKQTFARNIIVDADS